MSKDLKDQSINHVDQLYNRFLNLALNRFKWEGLPPGLESRKLEEFLVRHGRVACFKHDGGIYMLPCYSDSTVNIYGEPNTYRVQSCNGTLDKAFDSDDVVIIRNNALATNDHDDLLLFAERINDVEQTMDINLFHQITPYVILCDEKERLTFKNIMKQVKEFRYAIFGRKGLSVGQSDILDTRADYLLDKLQDHKTELMNEMLTFLGINNANTDKKERLVVDEVNANNDFILVNIDHMFDEREKAAEEINKKFGLNVTVKKREVEDVGSIYNDIDGDPGE